MLEFLNIPVAFAIDQWTKKWAEEHLKDGKKQAICKEKIRLGLVYNDGAFLGILKRNKGLLMTVNLVSALFLGIFLVGITFVKGHHFVKVGISFMLGGALGNIYDRIKRKRVVDFFAFGKRNVYYNIADFFVFIGGFLVLFGSLISSLKD